MAYSFGNRILQRATVSGTGSFTLGSSITGHRGYLDSPNVSSGDTVDYIAVDNLWTPTKWEIGSGVVTATTLTRVTVDDSSTGSVIDWGSSAKVYVGNPPPPASRVVARSPDGTLSLPYTTYVGGSAGAESLRVVPVDGSTRYVKIVGSNGGDPTISTSAGNLSISPPGGAVYLGSGANFLKVNGNSTTQPVIIDPVGSDSDISLLLSSKGSGAIQLVTGTWSAPQVVVGHTASANRYITLTGSNGGNPTIGTNAGGLTISAPLRLSSLPTSSAGLSTGDLWNDGGVLKIA